MSNTDSARPPSLSQVQIIRSLGEALAWLEKEIGWGVDPAELRHLTGRIGELYTAMTSRGQMALAVDQRGYDVVSSDGERISVKTVTSSGHVSFKKATIGQVDRITILRINIDDSEVSIEEVAQGTVEDILRRCQQTADGYRLTVSRRASEPPDLSHLQIVAEVVAGHRIIRQMENGSIVVVVDGIRVPKAKPILREVAAPLGIPLINGVGGVKNTRQLGAEIIANLRA